MINYTAYLNSKQWKARATKVKQQAGWRCQTCDRQLPLEAHHRTYDRLGAERAGDLIALCRRCHALIEAGKGMTAGQRLKTVRMLWQAWRAE